MINVFYGKTRDEATELRSGTPPKESNPENRDLGNN